MFGISGATFGAILRSAGKSYDDVAKAGFGFGVIGIVLSMFLLLIGMQITTIVSTIPIEATILEGAGFVSLLLASIVLGVGVFLSFIIGAALYDLSIRIINSFR